ncbi:helix-turn-helix domain-containing protein [Mastigocoleus testarum]|uniref:Transposase n=1 Tax=Mastigocoleus testarum BC008 TaxID=371196 RepID=A0A0V7ZDI7_9CYAN|nr:helix-turn-helix domain-containing protein [Mastigocoleus testarum]KST62042.1 transposase [Mastigocoleus testarum BC008]KST62624.1 transposase [Mastigocoleus testarum BC008]
MLHETHKINSQESSINTKKILTSFQRKLLQKSLQDELSDQYRQRIQIMLLADEGKTQAQICRVLGCCPATVRHWMHIARTGMAHQWQDCPIGRPKAVNEEYLERLKELLSDSPRDYGYSFRRWTINWLKKHMTKEFGIEISDRHLKRILKQMGLSTKPKPVKIQETSVQGKEGQSILIHDLKSANGSDSNGFWLFNPSNME